MSEKLQSDWNGCSLPKWLSSSIALALVVSTADARKVETTKLGRKALSQPQVQQDDRDLCFFRNDNDHWCYRGYEPTVRVGWDWQ